MFTMGLQIQEPDVIDIFEILNISSDLIDTISG